MNNGEFEKIWRLLSSLFPAAAAKKSKVDKAVWLKGLEPYAMTDVSDRIMTYAQRNKFFPDLADITGNLLQKQFKPMDIEMAEKLYARMKSKTPQSEVVARQAPEPEIQERRAYDFDCQKCQHNSGTARINCMKIYAGMSRIIYAGEDGIMHCREYQESRNDNSAGIPEANELYANG